MLLEKAMPLILPERKREVPVISAATYVSLLLVKPGKKWTVRNGEG